MAGQTEHNATMKDIARRMNVSVTTVSKVINGHSDISEKTRRKVLDTIREMGYMPNIMAANLRRNKGNVVGLVLSDVSKPYFGQVIEGYESTLYAAGYQTLIFNSMEDADRENRIIRQLVSMNAAGCIVDPAQNSTRENSALLSAEIPFVLSNRFFCEEEDYYVCADNEWAGRLATSHLLERKPGCPVLCVNGPDHISPTSMRFAGYRAALAQAGITPESSWIYDNNFDLPDAYAVGRQIAGQFRPPFSVFCSTDQLAIGVMRALNDAGMRVPEDVSLVGVDDIDMAAYLPRALSTVSLPKSQIGRASAEMLIRLIEKKDVEQPRCLLQPHLIIRETS